jgi:arginyl-tRNA synthetase
MIEPTAEKIGIGAVIFAFLKRSREKEMVFSWEETLNLEGESGPYIHYTYARGLNILRKVEGLEDRPDFSLLKEKVEIAIIQKLSVLQETIAEAISRNEPMVIARYVIELSKLFNSFYNSCKVITEEIKLKTARAKLIEACCIVIKKCLYLLGIETVDAM